MPLLITQVWSAKQTGNVGCPAFSQLSIAADSDLSEMTVKPANGPPIMVAVGHPYPAAPPDQPWLGPLHFETPYRIDRATGEYGDPPKIILELVERPLLYVPVRRARGKIVRNGTATVAGVTHAIPMYGRRRMTATLYNSGGVDITYLLYGRNWRTDASFNAADTNLYNLALPSSTLASAATVSITADGDAWDELVLRLSVGAGSAGFYFHGTTEDW